MKKIVCTLLALSMLLTMLAACNNEVSENPESPDAPGVVDPVEPENPDEPESVEPVVPVYTETEVGAENTLTGNGETITLNVMDNVLYITNLSTSKSNENLLAEKSPFVFAFFSVTVFNVTLPSSNGSAFISNEIRERVWKNWAETELLLSRVPT